MNEKIKEMLHCIEMNCKHNKCFGGVKLDEEDCKLLLDYITNLQKAMEQTEIYKSRCKKVNKLITDFMCTEEYCNVDPIAIAENYMKIQKALIGSDENE